MRSPGWLVAVMLMACGSANLQADRALFFGDLGLGEQRDVALLLVTSGDAPLTLTFGTSSTEFSPLERSRTLGAGQSGSLLIRFSPSDLGPRTGKLIIDSALGRSLIALSGRGTGPRLAAPEQVVLPPAALVAGEPARGTETMTLRNIGTLGSQLVLQPPRVDGAELCVGTFVDSVCQPWSAPAALATEALLEVPLSLRATSAGARHFTVELTSNDVLHPVVAVDVDVLVEAFEPCVFSAPSELLLAGPSKELRISNVGPGTCLVQSATLYARPSMTLTMSAPEFPLRLQSGASFSLWLGVNPLVSGPRNGLVQVDALGTAALQVQLGWEPSSSRCLTIVPSVIDFGQVKMECNSPSRSVQLYNSCSTPLTVSSVVVASAAGEGPGGPNCPGTTPCPEFFMVTGVQSGTVLAPGSSTPVVFQVKYRPINYGPDTGAVVVHMADEGELVLAVQGSGTSSGQQVDTFRQDPLPLVDVLVMVDSSPSFVPRRPDVRANLTSFLTRIGSLCWDARVGFAPADLDPDAGVELLTNDAGARWTSSREPAFVDRALSAFDALPTGSELEGCVGPASAVMQDAGVRDGGSLSGICITDALEQTPNPMAALQALGGPLPSARFTWSAITGHDSSPCAIEAADDGVHLALVSASNGARDDVCGPSWWRALVPFGSFGCGYGSRFFLTSRSAGPLDVRIEGQPVPSSDWTYDVANNSIVFVQGREPAPGQTLTVAYDPQCIP